MKLSRSTFCTTLEKLNVKRIIFLGDSLMRQMVLSFWKIIHNSSHDIPFDLSDNVDYQIHSNQLVHKIQCPPAPFPGMSSFELIFIRNDSLMENTEYGKEVE